MADGVLDADRDLDGRFFGGVLLPDVDVELVDASEQMKRIVFDGATEKQTDRQTMTERQSEKRQSRYVEEERQGDRWTDRHRNREKGETEKQRDK